MTLEDRLANIKNRAMSDKQAELDAKAKEEAEREALIDKIASYSERINTILTLANACIQNGVKIPEKRPFTFDYDSAAPYGYPNEFIAEGICHHTGLIRTWPEYQKGQYEYIGIKNGGANGCWHFWTNGDTSFAVNEDISTRRTEPRIYDMQKFLKEFPVFEKAFLKFIDTL